MRAQRDVFGTRAIAHSSLKGQVSSDNYTDGKLLRVASPTADIRSHFEASAPERQILYGHLVRQLENTQGFSRDETSGYVGFIAPETLRPWIKPTHRVRTRATFLFAEPDFKHPNPLALSLGSLLTITDHDGKYAKTDDGKYAITDHLEPIDKPEADLAATAENLLGTPYLWAGNSSFGIDCSGLIQLCLQRAGQPCPGDSDQQQALGIAASTSYQRNDLLFWKGHVALVTDPNTLIHANAGAMATVFEPIDHAITRITNQSDGPITAHRRIPPLSDLNSSPPEA